MESVMSIEVETLSPQSPEEALFQAWTQHRDREALAELFRRLAKPALAVAQRFAGDLAEDAVQEGFLCAMRGASPRSTGQARAWILAVVANSARNQRRSAERRSHHEKQVPTPIPEEPKDNEDSERVRALLARLSEHERTAVELRIIDGCSTLETARILNRRPGTVDVQVHRALERLRTWMGAATTPAAIVLAVQTSATSGAEPSGNLLYQIDHLATTGPLPTASIGLGAWIAGAVGLASTAAITGVLVWGGKTTGIAQNTENPPIPAPVSATTVKPWTGRAAELLQQIDPKAPMTMGLDFDWLRNEAATHQPSSVLFDPRVQAGLQDLRRQWTLWAANSPMPDLGKVVDAGGGMAFQVNADTKELFAYELGDQASACYKCWSYLTSGTRLHQYKNQFIVGENFTPPFPFAGKKNLQDFPLESPLWFRGRFQEVLQTFATLDQDRSDPVGLSSWFGPDWRTAAPTITARLRADPGVWSFVTDLDGINLPLHTIDPALSGLISQAKWGHIAIGIDPIFVEKRLLSFLLGRHLFYPHPISITEKTQETPWIPGLTGDAVLTINPGPLPIVSLVLGLKEAKDQTASIDKLVKNLRGFPDRSDPQGRTWTIATPLGLVKVVQGQDRLVASTSTQSLDSLFATATGPAIQCQAQLDMAAVKPWLPMVTGFFASQFQKIEKREEYFDSTDLELSLEALESTLFANVHNVGEPGKQSRVIFDHLSENLTACAQNILSRSDVDPYRLRVSVSGSKKWPKGEDEPAAKALLLLRKISNGKFDPDRHLAVFCRQSRGFILSNPRVCLKTTKGWWSLGVTDYALTRQESPKVFDDIANNITVIQVSKTPLDKLEALEIEEQPHNRWSTWFPPESFAALADHIPNWQFKVAPTTQGWRIEEQGWPLHWLASWASVLNYSRYLPFSSMIKTHHYLSIDRRDGEQVRRRNADKLTAIETIWKAIVAFMNEYREHLTKNSLPALSVVLRQANIESSKLTPLFGHVPTPAEIDALGRYVPCDWVGNPANNNEIAMIFNTFDTVLTIPLEPGWCVQVSSQKTYPPITTSYPFPTTPQPGDPKPGTERLEKPKPKEVSPIQAKPVKAGADDF